MQALKAVEREGERENKIRKPADIEFLVRKTSSVSEKVQERLGKVAAGEQVH